MLDAGRAKREKKDPHIKHFTDFEPISICKLLNSPDYIGRSYSRKHTNPEKYIKNKQICKLIDDIRYQTGLNGKDCRNKHAAKLHYKGFIHTNLDGGKARTIYNFADKLDLGDAGPECYEGLIPDKCNLQENTCEPTSFNSAYVHYTEFNQSKMDGGNAKSSYTLANKINLGDAGAECYEPFVPCNNLEETRQSANLQYEGIIDPNLDGGSARSTYTLANKLDLGDAGDESVVLSHDPHSYANLHYKGYTHSNLDGGNAKSSYTLANKLNLGDAGDKCVVNPLDELHQYANIDYKGVLHSNVDGGIASTLYTPTNKLDLGNSGIKCHEPLVHTKKTQGSANLHYKEFPHSQLNGGNASSSYTSADKLDLGAAQLVKSY